MLNGFGDAAQIEALRAGLAKEFGVKVAYNGADMSKPAQIRAMVEPATKELGSVDILVNNAGIQHTAPVDELPARPLGCGDRDQPVLRLPRDQGGAARG